MPSLFMVGGSILLTPCRGRLLLFNPSGMLSAASLYSLVRYP